MFSTFTHAENLALLRAIVEAKFHHAPNDSAVPESAILGQVAHRLREVIVAEEVRREGASALSRWREWEAISPARPEWGFALKFAVSAWHGCWRGWTAVQRESAVGLLLSPYVANATQLSAFVDAVGDALSQEHL